jgi:O-antigen ligase
VIVAERLGAARERLDVAQYSLGPALLVSALGALTGLASTYAPSATIAAAAGLVFTIVTLRNLAAGVSFFVLLTFFDRSTAFQSGALTGVKLAGAVLAVVWLFQLATRRTEVPNLFVDQPILSFGMLAFVIWNLASALWATDAGEALHGSGGSAVRFAQGIVLAFIVPSALRTRAELRWVLWAYLAGAMFAAAVGLMGGAYSQSASVNDARLSGGFDDPNELAAVLVPGIAIAGMWWLATPARSMARWAYAFCVAFFLFSLVRTESQAGYLALATVIVVAIAASGPVRRQVVVATLAFALVTTAYYTFVARPTVITTLASEENTGARESLWKVGLSVLTDHPIAGVGAGNFVAVEAQYGVSNLDLPRFDQIGQGELVHNSYLQVAAELGIIGLVAFVAILGAALAASGRAIRCFSLADDREFELVARGLFLGTLGMLVAYFFATNQYEKQLWLLLAIGFAFLNVARRTIDERRPRGTRHRRSRLYRVTSVSDAV